jgi:uncharacterized protein YndB with AHSA1/START domain
MTQILNPALDLSFERIVDVTPEQIWAAWTQPEHIVHWFTPVPWQTVSARIDLRAGGEFYTVMRSPEGQEFPNSGCYLELIPNRKLVWTNVLQAGFRPAPNDAIDGCGPFLFTAIVKMEPHPSGSKYTAYVLHQTEAGCEQHKGMGFEQGWGAALDQLCAYMKSLA